MGILLSLVVDLLLDAITFSFHPVYSIKEYYSAVHFPELGEIGAAPDDIWTNDFVRSTFSVKSIA
jgi:hypothetical protein